MFEQFRMQQKACGQDQDRQSKSQQVSEQEFATSLLNTLVNTYNQMRFPSTHKIKQIEAAWRRNQQHIYTAIQFRKQLESIVKYSEIKQQHSAQLQKTNERYEKYENLINELSKNNQEKANYIIRLEKQIISLKQKERIRLSQASQLEKIERNSIAKMQDNMKQIRNNLNFFHHQLKQLDNLDKQYEEKQIQGEYQKEELRRKKENLREKQMAINSKLQSIKIKQQMMEYSQSCNRIYMNSLSEGMKIYEEVITHKISQERKKSKKGKGKNLQRDDQLIEEKEKEYNRLCREQLHLYESELIRLRQENDRNVILLQNFSKSIKQQQEEIQMLKVNIVENIKTKQELQKRSQSLIFQLQQQIGSIQAKLKQVKIDCLNKSKIIEDYSKCEKQLKELFAQQSQQVKKLTKMLSMREEQITSLRKTNQDLEKMLKQSQQNCVIVQNRLAIQSVIDRKKIEDLEGQLRSEKQRATIMGIEQEKSKRQLEKIEQSYRKSIKNEERMQKSVADLKKFCQLKDLQSNTIKNDNQGLKRILADRQKQIQAFVIEKQKGQKQKTVQQNSIFLQQVVIIKQALAVEIEKEWQKSQNQIQAMINNIMALFRQNFSESAQLVQPFHNSIEQEQIVQIRSSDTSGDETKMLVQEEYV